MEAQQEEAESADERETHKVRTVSESGYTPMLCTIFILVTFCKS